MQLLSCRGNRKDFGSDQWSKDCPKSKRTIDTPVDQIVDATGLTLLPGIVDDQVHFRQPGLTHKEDLRARLARCAKGGITSLPGDAEHDSQLHDSATTRRETGNGQPR